MQEYPKWVRTDGPGHPQNPGFLLVENEEQEATAIAEGTGPADLNPPAEASQKTLDEMDRADLIQVLVAEGIPDDMSDDEIRNAIRHGREAREQHVKEDQEEAERDRLAREAGGDHGDGQQTDQTAPNDPEARTDAAGEKIPPNVADEANKGDNAAPRTAPEAKTAAATDTRPDDAKKKEADDKPAGSVTEAAATPPKHKRGAASVPGKE